MKRSLIWTTAGAAVIGFGVPAYAAVQTSNPQPSNNTVQNNVEDISGPCDEAEHADDPRCASVTVATQGTQPSTSVDDSVTDSSVTDNSVTDNSVTDNSVDDSVTDNTTDNSVDDISGPCDEAEHANDPRCTGAAADSDDNSGPGRGDDDDDDDDDDDHSGHGGGDDDDDDNSGHGGGDDD